MTEIAPQYIYRASVIKIIDGDTYTLDLDYGFGQHGWQRIRLHGWNCPEHGTTDGDRATAEVTKLLNDAAEILVQSYHDRRSFERWVADVWVDGTHLGELLAAVGLAFPMKR